MSSNRSASPPAGGSKANQVVHPGTAVLLSVMFILIGSVVALWFASGSLFRLAPLQVLLGSAIFVALIALVVVVFARLGLYDRTAALGLPDGSVRALIALILLIIFITFANVVFGQLSTSTTSQSIPFSGLTEVQVQGLPGPVENQREMTTPAGQTPRWEGTYRVTQPSQDAATLGQQIVTGLLTLVAAISAFYFGTGSVAAGASVLREARRGGGGLRIIRPSQPVGLTPKDDDGYSDLEVELGGLAIDASGVVATIESNDRDGQLQRGTSDSQFVYSPSTSATDPVTLRFTSADDDRNSVRLIVRVPPKTEATTGEDTTGQDTTGEDTTGESATSPR